MEAQARALADGMVEALPGWVERSVVRIAVAWKGSATEELRAQAAAAGRRAAEQVGPELRALLESDVDNQRSTPLAVARGAVRFPTEVLMAAGVPPVVRDRVQEQLFPEDIYDLAPATFADIDPRLADVGLEWSAAKAHTHLRRRRRTGQRAQP